MRPDEHIGDEEGIDFGGTSAWMLTAPSITHAEITEQLERGGRLRGATIEAQDDGPAPKYAVYLLVSWRRPYCILNVFGALRPRLFREISRLLVMIRSDYQYRGMIAMTLASDTEGRRRYRLPGSENAIRGTANGGDDD